MLALIRYLENEIDAPEHWVCTSHLSLTFHNEDFESYRKGVIETRVLNVGMLEGKQGVYEINKLTTSDIEIAGEWIRQILNRPLA